MPKVYIPKDVFDYSKMLKEKYELPNIADAMRQMKHDSEIGFSIRRMALLDNWPTVGVKKK
jgi:hypothetical protein